MSNESTSPSQTGSFTYLPPASLIAGPSCTETLGRGIHSTENCFPDPSIVPGQTSSWTLRSSYVPSLAIPRLALELLKTSVRMCSGSLRLRYVSFHLGLPVSLSGSCTFLPSSIRVARLPSMRPKYAFGRSPRTLKPACSLRNSLHPIRSVTLVRTTE